MLHHRNLLFFRLSRRWESRENENERTNKNLTARKKFLFSAFAFSSYTKPCVPDTMLLAITQPKIRSGLNHVHVFVFIWHRPWHRPWRRSFRVIQIEWRLFLAYFPCGQRNRPPDDRLSADDGWLSSRIKEQLTTACFRPRPSLVDHFVHSTI